MDKYIDKIRVVSYNIDGLPEVLDLRDLPFILKPISWIYKLIKGTTIIPINDNQNKASNINSISKKLLNLKADIIGVQEDFNYHDTLMNYLRYDFDSNTYTEGFDLSNLFSITEWCSKFPLPRFKADGLNLITRDDFLSTEEDIVGWRKSNGYFSHCNDELTHKGFRFYHISDGVIEIDVYVLHMDADFYPTDNDISKDIEARKSQLIQISDYIIDRHNRFYYPSIVLGDTNLNNYWWDVDTLIECFIDKIEARKALHVNSVSACNNSIDKIFYINDDYSDFYLTEEDSYIDNTFVDENNEPLSDHFPLVADFKIVKRTNN